MIEYYKKREGIKQRNKSVGVHPSIGMSEDCIFDMIYSCLSNSFVSLGDKVGITSRSARTLDFSSTSFTVVGRRVDLT